MCVRARVVSVVCMWFVGVFMMRVCVCVCVPETFGCHVISHYQQPQSLVTGQQQHFIQTSSNNNKVAVSTVLGP